MTNSWYGEKSPFSTYWRHARRDKTFEPRVTWSHIWSSLSLFFLPRLLAEKNPEENLREPGKWVITRNKERAKKKFFPLFTHYHCLWRKKGKVFTTHTDLAFSAFKANKITQIKINNSLLFLLPFERRSPEFPGIEVQNPRNSGVSPEHKHPWGREKKFFYFLLSTFMCFYIGHILKYQMILVNSFQLFISIQMFWNKELNYSRVSKI